MKVKSQKKEKNQALGYILSLAAMAAVVAVFAAAVLNFQGGQAQGRRRLSGRQWQGLRSSAMPLRAVILPAWDIWRRIMRSRLTGRNTMCFTMVLHPM